MRIADRLNGNRPAFSFEFFPPKSEEALQRLYATIEHLSELEPTYVSVTYGAGGSTRNRTVDLCAHIKHRIGIETMAHLTGNTHQPEEIREIVRGLEDAGIDNVLALRGDPPRGAVDWTPPEGAFHYAADLVSYIRSLDTRLCVGAACYPEGHVEAESLGRDLDHLAEKVQRGVDFLITQLFFDNAHYFDFVRRVRERGISVPIIPGIMPVTDVGQLERFTKMCGSSIPDALRAKLEKVRDDDQAVMAVGIEWAIRQCRELLALGAPGIHFYTINRSLATRVVCTSLQGFTYAR